MCTSSILFESSSIAEKNLLQYFLLLIKLHIARCLFVTPLMVWKLLVVGLNLRSFCNTFAQVHNRLSSKRDPYTVFFLFGSYIYLLILF